MNSWNIDFDELPSMGKEYDEDSYIKIHPLSVANCKYLCTLNPKDPLKATKLLNEVLESCITTNIDFDKLVWADRNYLLFWLRVNSFINSNGYDLNIACPFCGEQISKTLRLDDFEIKYYNQCQFMNVTLEIGDREVKICSNIPLVGEEKIYCDDKIIEDILNFTNIREYIPNDADPMWWVSQIDAMNFAKLKTIAERCKFGIEGIINITCDSCNKIIPVDVDVSDTNMFGKISLYELLKIQIQVSKYCGFQISDELSYTDVELMQEVIKELIEEEKAEIEKQKGNSLSLTKPNIKAPNFKMPKIR